MNALQLTKLPEGIPTLEDLKLLFPKLPPPDKVNSTVLCIPMMAEVSEVLAPDSKLVIERRRSVAIAVIKFEKFPENKDGQPHMIWVYKGIVKP